MQNLKRDILDGPGKLELNNALTANPLIDERGKIVPHTIRFETSADKDETADRVYYYQVIVDSVEAGNSSYTIREAFEIKGHARPVPGAFNSIFKSHSGKVRILFNTKHRRGTITFLDYPEKV